LLTGKIISFTLNCFIFSNVQGLILGKLNIISEADPAENDNELGKEKNKENKVIGKKPTTTTVQQEVKSTIKR